MLLAILGSDAFWFEPSSLRLRAHHLTMAEPKASRLRGMRIVIIADLHGGSAFVDVSKIRRVVDLANGSRPDLILLAGDYVSHGSSGGLGMPVNAIMRELRRLGAPLGVFAVSGNHDNWVDRVGIASALEGARIRVVDNKSVPIEGKHGRFYLVGIGDTASGFDDRARAFAGVGAEDSAICLTHSPDAFPGLPESCRLTVAGHTHGGQVNLPIVGRLIVPSKFGQRYAAGLIHERGKWLFVSTGIGTSILPVRFGVPPEVSELDIN